MSSRSQLKRGAASPANRSKCNEDVDSERCRSKRHRITTEDQTTTEDTQKTHQNNKRSDYFFFLEKAKEQLFLKTKLTPGSCVYVRWVVEHDETENPHEFDGSGSSYPTRKENPREGEYTGFSANNVKQSLDCITTDEIVWWKGELSLIPVIKDGGAFDGAHWGSAEETFDSSYESKNSQGDNSSAEKETTSAENESSELIIVKGREPSHNPFCQDGAGDYLWHIYYEEMVNFAAETCRVVFLDHEKVSHLDYEDGKNALYYANKMPQNKDEFEATKRQEALGVDESDFVVTLQDILEAQVELDREQGDEKFPTAESFLLNEFDTLPHPVKIEMALQYRKFADDCATFLKQMITDKGGSHVVTKDEVVTFFQLLRAKHVHIRTEECGRKTSI